MPTNYDALIPQGVLFNFQEIQDMKLLKKDMARKLVFKGKIEVVKIGAKIHISRSELIRYLEENTFAVTS